MITKFEFFNEGRFANIVYDEAVEINEYEKRIKNYFTEKYPEESPIFSHRKEFSATSIGKIVKFAKKHNDETLTALINDYLDFIENINTRMDAKKYNI